MKRITVITICILFLAVLQAEVVDKIIARVGKDIILLSDLMKQINQMKSAGLIKEGTKESEILEQMIESRLIIQKAKELNYTTDPNKIRVDVEKELKKIRNRYSSEEEFNLALRQMKLTRTDLYDFFEEKIKEQRLTQQFYQKEILPKVVISEKEMLSFYLLHKDSLAVKPITYDIGMIIRQIKASPETEQKKLNEIRSIQKKLKEGADFAELAKQESDCLSAKEGGDLGFFGKGKMVKPFEEAAFKLQIGEISDVVKTNYGYHLIKLEEKRGDEIRVRHILKLISPSEQDSLAAKAQMESIRVEFLKGKSFSELASKWSEDEESAKNGGSIGEYSSEDFPELFAPILNALTTGGISEVLEHEGMLYLFSKLKEIPAKTYSFEEIKPKIKEILTQQRMFKVYLDWIEQLKKEFNVELLI